MAHFAKLDNNKIVTEILVVKDSDTFDSNGVESETVGIEFLRTVTGHSDWKKTSYNTRKNVHYTIQENNSSVQSEDQSKAFRKNFASIGYTYDETRDAFIEPKPYDSWTLNETTCVYDPPVAFPNDGNAYEWNEETTSWDLINPDSQ